MKRTSRIVDLDAEIERTEEKAQIYAEGEGLSGMARLYTCELSRAVSDAKTLLPARLRRPLRLVLECREQLVPTQSRTSSASA